MLAHVDGSDVTSAVDVFDTGFSDHYLLTADINMQQPRSDLLHYVFRDIRRVDPMEFAAQMRQTKVFVDLADDVDDYAKQLNSGFQLS